MRQSRSAPSPRAPGLPGSRLSLRKSGKPDLRWGRGGEGGGCCFRRCVRQLRPPPPTPPHKGRGVAPSKVQGAHQRAGTVCVEPIGTGAGFEINIAAGVCRTSPITGSMHPHGRGGPCGPEDGKPDRCRPSRARILTEPRPDPAARSPRLNGGLARLGARLDWYWTLSPPGRAAFRATFGGWATRWRPPATCSAWSRSSSCRRRAGRR